MLPFLFFCEASRLLLAVATYYLVIDVDDEYQRLGRLFGQLGFIFLHRRFHSRTTISVITAFYLRLGVQIVSA